MEFTDEELIVIGTTLQICIVSIDKKKGHKSKNEILVQNQMKKISEKIDNYMEEKKNGISRKF